jgi:hypothetical protein
MNRQPYNNRKQTKKSNKARLIISIVLLLIISSIAYVLLNKPSTNPKTTSNNNVTNTQSSLKIAAIESGLLPWHLSAPLSRMALFPNGKNLTIVGGLTSSGSSASGIFNLNTSNGNLALTTSLPNGVHDAASSMINGKPVIFGGGQTASVNLAQTLSSNQGVIKTGKMPQLRSDATAVTVKNTTYIIGGYNGTNADSQILTTTNGTVFHNYGNLPVAVRYAAVASLNNIIYVFGGMSASNSNSGTPLETVQIINTNNHTISKASWKLPMPLEGASAVVLNNAIYLVGGQSNIKQNIPLGVGTTQVDGISVTNTDTSNNIYAVNTQTHQFLLAGHLQVPVSNAGIATIGSTAWLVGGESNNQVVDVVQMLRPNKLFGIAGTPGVGSPYYGDKLMIADRGNNRILVMNSSMNITWKYPSKSLPASNKNFYFPDDAFFANHGHAIISNQENNNTIVKIGYPSGKLLWSYGHAKVAGTAPGYLQAPDDAYQLKNGQIVVADDQNCRILFINPNKTIAHQIGVPGICKHNPGVSLGSPNGDTPLYDGNILISEIIGSWVSEYTPTGHMVWAVHLPISYPSDPQQLNAGPGKNTNLYLIADYTNPGAILTFNRQGQVLSRYQPTSGPGRLNSPSLVELLPSGVYMANDDHRDRMVAIDPKTGALVWQYGVSDHPGSTHGMLNKVDGFDILAPNGTTPTHGASG